MENKEKDFMPTFDQLPGLVAGLAMQIGLLVKQLAEKPVVQSEPMGIELCAEYLSLIEGKEVTKAAVYNRVHRGRLPYCKNGATLYFLREDISAHLMNPEVSVEREKNSTLAARMKGKTGALIIEQMVG